MNTYHILIKTDLNYSVFNTKTSQTNLFYIAHVEFEILVENRRFRRADHASVAVLPHTSASNCYFKVRVWYSVEGFLFAVVCLGV